MNQENFMQQYNLLFEQRKKLIYLVVAQAAGIIIMATALIIQIINPTVIVTPPTIEAPFKVIGGKLCDSGLKQHANYFVHLYLDLTPESIDTQYIQFTQNIHPGAIVEFKKQLSEHEAVVKKLNLSSRFDIVNITTNVKEQTATVKGRLVLYQGPSLQSEKEKTFVMKFVNQFGKPFITKISEINHES